MLTGIVVAHEVVKVKVWCHLRETKLLVVGCAWQVSYHVFKCVMSFLPAGQAMVKRNFLLGPAAASSVYLREDHPENLGVRLQTYLATLLQQSNIGLSLSIIYPQSTTSTGIIVRSKLTLWIFPININPIQPQI